MRIAIDCADLDCQRIDGTRVYIKNLLDWFGQIDKKDDFLLYHQTNFNPELQPARFKNYIDKKIPYRFWWTQTRLAFELKKDRPDVLWMPIQQLPYLSEKEKYKKVVTIHDLAFKIFPRHFKVGDRFKLNLFTDYAIKKADRIIAVSNSTKNDILKFYPKIDSDKIKVIYHGINAGKFQINLKFKIKNLKFILYLGAIQPRKNLEVLVEAFEKLKSDKKYSDFKLILAGEPAWLAEKILTRIENSICRKDIILKGKVSFKEAAELYQQARIFVLPSLYEGFGMPVLEAWSADTPVIVADNSSLREIGGEAVEKFEAQNLMQLTEKIKLILSDEKRREDLIKKGKERLKNFSWEKCARETLRVLKN